jgi:uncharacterized protein with PQ loop repeat
MPELSPLQIALIPIVGVIVATLSVVSKMVGTPDQIRKNYERKSTHGLSLIAYSISFVTYSFWALYGALKEDWVIFFAHGGLGSIVTGLVLWQFYIYRRDNRTK